MSKTITIPKYNNPFTLNINNKEYTYRGGDTIEVPDEVAEAIEDALELVPKPNKKFVSNKVDLSIDVAHRTISCDIPISDLLKRLDDEGYECVNIKLYSYGHPIAYQRVNGSLPNYLKIHYMYRSTEGEDDTPAISFEQVTVKEDGTMTFGGEGTFVSG